MSRKTLHITDSIYDYLLAYGVRESPALEALRDITAAMPGAQMQISPEQGAFMAMLVRLLGARRGLEIGTYTGYSALAIAEAMPDDGRLITCDISEEYTAVATAAWRDAGVDHKIDLRLAPAADTLADLLTQGGQGAFDYLFIDADKTGYDTYYELGLQLVRTGGLMAIDNVLWNGSVIDDRAQDDDTVAIRTLNLKIRRDNRVDMVMTPVGDGLTLVRPRPGAIA